MPGTSTNGLRPREQLERDKLDNALFAILEEHLTGVGRGILRAKLEDLCNNDKYGGKSALTLFNEAHISADNAEKLKTLLCVTSHFNEPDTLLGWIKVLSQKDYGHRHLEDFYHLVREVKPRKSWAVPLFLTTLATAVGGLYLSIVPKHLIALENLVLKVLPIISTFLQTTFSILRNIPLALLIKTIISVPYTAYLSFSHNHLRSLPKRIQKWAADVLPDVLSFIAYAICYSAKGVFTPLAVGFFITSSLVAVVNSLFNFYQLRPIGEEPLKDKAPLEVKLDYIRQKERRSRTAQTALVNLVASVLVSLTVILWGIFPPSFMIMVGAIIFINLVEFTKNAMLTRIHTKGAENLQKELKEMSFGLEITPPDAIQAREQVVDASIRNLENKLITQLEVMEQRSIAREQKAERLEARLNSFARIQGPSPTGNHQMSCENDRRANGHSWGSLIAGYDPTGITTFFGMGSTETIPSQQQTATPHMPAETLRV